MASKTQISDFRKIMTEIRKGNFAPVYLLMGEEAYYIDRIVEALEQSVVAEDERDFNMTVLYGQDTDVRSVIAACQQYPFMADRKLVVLKEAQTMQQAKAALENLAEYVARPSDSNVLVVTYKGGVINATGKLMKSAAKSEAVIFKSPLIPEWELDAPIKEYCQTRKIGIDEKAVAMLKDFIGASISKIYTALDKVVMAGGDSLTRITPELIEANIGISKEFNNFELISALGQRNYDRCMLIVKQFSSNPRANPTPPTAASIFNYFTRLLCGHLATNKSEAGIMAAMDVKNSYIFKKDYAVALRNYNAMQCVKIIHLVREFDCNVKGIRSNQNEFELLTELIFNIFSTR
ncbi:MAG: DNA polymerase III subunit delta [Muribaculaceae bacterium]|nr:DNA polymerase III subunit delta [Muribaculaceae bacterium]MDE6448163.1 DNA polymerase III subunit delta [Muribaculaceae bacterium]